MTKSARGFTIIEILVVVAVIGILATISLVGFNRYQADTRDAQRSSKATILAEALEKYYDNNGEYPGCLAVSGTGATVTTSILPGVELNTLLTPKSTSTDTNSIKCQDLVIGGPDIFAYVGDGSTACSNGQACLSWTLKYKEESTGVIKTITSRRTTDPTTLINVVATTNSSTQITASWNSAPEAVTYNLEYAQNSSFTGSTFVNGLTSTSRAVTGLASGQRYYFRIYIVTNLATGQASPSANAVTTLNAPSAPTVAATTPDAITTYSWPAIACPAGATARYQYRYVIDYTGGYTSVWYGPIAGLSSTLDTSDPGYTYTAQVQAQCYNANTVSAWSATGQSSFYRAGWSNIAAARGFTCSLTFAGKAYCWGGGSRLGNGSSTGSSVPVAVTDTGVLSGKTLVAIEAGESHTCALDSAGKAYCWGYNFYGQLGNNSTTDSPVPVAVTTTGVLSGKTLIAIEAGNHTTCVLDSLGKAYCWGYNAYGQLGNNSTTDSPVPVAVTTTGVLSGKTLVAIAAGDHTCALDSAGKAYCWGRNGWGQLGDNSTVYSHVPVAVTTTGVLSGKTLVSVGGSYIYPHACALDSLGKAYCWGQGSNSQLGNNSTADSPVPVAVTTTGVLSGKTLVVIAVGGTYPNACALDSLGKAYCWGKGANGVLGNNSTTDSPVPVAVTTTGVLSGKTLVVIAVGGLHNCAIDSAGKAYCWGENSGGALGNNSTTSSLVPVAVMLAP